MRRCDADTVDEPWFLVIERDAIVRSRSSVFWNVPAKGRKVAMSKFRLTVVLLASAVASGSAMALAAQRVTVQTVPNMYVFCQYRVAAIFPGEPMIRDFMYTNGTWTVPARQFYVERGMDRYSVTIADFSKGGPAIDDTIVENAAIALRQTRRSRDPVSRRLHAGHSGPPVEHLSARRPPASRLDLHGRPPPYTSPKALRRPSDFAAIQLEQSMLVHRRRWPRPQQRRQHKPV